MKCITCGERLPWSAVKLQDLVTLNPTQCDNCKNEAEEIPHEEESVEEKPDITLEFNSNALEEMPEEVRNFIEQDLAKDGLSLADVAEVGAIKIDKSNPKHQELVSKMEVLHAREAFGHASAKVIEAIHALNHAGVPHSELKLVITQFTKFQYEFTLDYLGFEAKGDEYQWLLDKNTERCLKCDFHDDGD